MKIISSFRELEPFGLIILTGEACGLGYRILFDVTAAGKKVVEKCFGIPNMTFAEAWNRGTAETPRIPHPETELRTDERATGWHPIPL